MKKPSLFLFALRLFFYLSVAGLVYIHPGIAVSYDKIGFIQWFIIIPLEALIAFLPPPRKKPRNRIILAILPLAVLSVWAGGFSPAALPPACAGAIAFILTLLLFHYPRWSRPRWASLSALEPFFLAWICFRLLVFSRSGEDAAGESFRLTQIILVWTAIVFLFHSAVVYFCLHSGSRGAGAEAAVFGVSALAALALVFVVLPADFIRSTVIENMLTDKKERMIKPSDNDWAVPDDGGGRKQGRRTLPGDGNRQGPSLRSLSEHDWPGEGGRKGRSRNGRGEGQEQQYTVMVVASKHEPVYMGDSVRGRLDPVAGFLSAPDEVLNRLPSQRLFVTWFDSEPVYDRGRERCEVFSLSTLSQRYLPYRPFAVEPAILSENTGPFRYIHRLSSDIHIDEPFDLLFSRVRELSPIEKTRLAPYLEFPLEDSDGEVFRAHLERILDSWQERRAEIMGRERNDYMEKILAILLGFSDFQYNANDENNSSVSDLINFLLNTKDGDCVEFSNSAALLARLAGIPSRVVTGSLAAEGLQTAAHVRGLAAIRSRLPVLQQFPSEDLYLVTDAHGHSWPQFYIPDYGWIDFEATTFAIAPIGFGDGNLRDVVIPLLDENRVFAPVRAFPWRAVLRFLSSLAVLALLAAYALRYGRELALYIGVRRGGREGARSLYLLLLARLAADGCPIKPVSKTAPEYAQLFTGGTSTVGGVLATFAAIYTELRWRNFSDSAEMEKRFDLLKAEYSKILTENRRRGAAAFIKRLFSLRGLAYW